MFRKLVSIFADRGRRVVSAMNPYGRILGFLDRNNNNNNGGDDDADTIIIELFTELLLHY
jgi:hypothetical protein